MKSNNETNLPVHATRHSTHLREFDPQQTDGADLARQIQTIQATSQQPQSAVWRRALLIWLRIYQWEKIEGSKARRLDLRIPIPLPIIGIFFRRRLTWDQALQALCALRRAPDAEMIEPYLDARMAVEVLRIEEEKGQKQELLVIGLD
jgi:hypothetical protein